MKARPILFSGPMVRAILEGRKTQTRRVVKRQGDMEFDPADPYFGPYWLAYATDADGEDAKVRCPYGVPGNRLWVRETYAWSGDSSIPEADRIASGEVWYRADGERGGGIRWRPSIFMPRWASRILLEITGVRVERLLEISEADAQAEGIDLKGFRSQTEGIAGREHRIHYRDLWESINGAGSWDANPWVWVVSFRRVER